jgi:hypothetical protein
MVRKSVCFTIVALMATAIQTSMAMTFGNNCVFCTQVVPECPSCAVSEYCQITPRTCTSCASAKCRPLTEAPTGYPDPASTANTSHRKPTRVPGDNTEDYRHCVACLRHATCPNCPKDMQCELTLQSCSECSFAVCASRSK